MEGFRTYIKKFGSIKEDINHLVFFSEPQKSITLCFYVLL